MKPSPAWVRYPRALATIVALGCCAVGCSDEPARDADAGTHDAARHDATLPVEAASPPDDLTLSPRDAASTPSDGALSATIRDAASSDAALTPSDADTDAASADAMVAPPAPTFVMRVVTRDLASPWELTFGPDGALWVTERTAARVSRVDPVTGARTTLLAIPDAYQASGQDGLLGLTAQAELVYLAYTYDADPGAPVDRRAKVVRYRYTNGALSEPMVLLDALPASSDHNSGRLALGPDQTLYYSIGDQGNNQFERKCERIRAQDLPTQLEVDARDWSTYQGKILRLALDGSVPADNPVLAGVRSHVFSYGHRNAQGLAFGADGALYASEQGPKTDDELNAVFAGANYGWPFVAGFRDERAYVYGNWSAAADCAQLAYSDDGLPASVPVQTESTAPAFSSPVRTFYSVDSGHDFSDPLCGADAYICWPTIAPSSLAVYTHAAIPSWTGSFLLTSLKDGAVHRVRGSDDELLFRTVNRYRDLAVAADGRAFYVATDASGQTRALDGSPTRALAHPGAILEFRLVL